MSASRPPSSAPRSCRPERHVAPEWLLVALLLAALPRSALAQRTAPDATRWHEVRTTHFTSLTDGEPGRVARLLRDLERFREVLDRTTRGLLRERPRSLYLVVFRDPRSLEPFNLIVPETAVPPIGYFASGVDASYLAFAFPTDEDARRVLYHEFLHSLLADALPGAPLWLHEGMAEFYSTLRLGRDHAEVGRPIAIHAAWLRARPMLGLAGLLVVDASSSRYSHAAWQGVFYAQSWALTHMLHEGSEDAGTRFGRFLTALRRGRPAFAALHDVYGPGALDSLETALGAYAKRESFRFRRYEFTEAFEAIPASVRTIPEADVHVRLGGLLLTHTPPRALEAKTHFAAATRLDPDDARGWTGLGRCADLEDDAELAATHFERAMELAPADPLVPLHAALGILARAERERSAWRSLRRGTSPEERRARALLRRSIAADPERFEALLSFARTFLDESPDSLFEGIGALMQAAEVDPARSETFVVHAALSAASGNRNAALAMIEHYLEPTGSRELVRQARLGVHWQDLRRVAEMLRGSDLDGAQAILEQVLGEEPGAEVQRLANELQRSLQAARGQQD